MLLVICDVLLVTCDEMGCDVVGCEGMGWDASCYSLLCMMHALTSDVYHVRCMLSRGMCIV